MSVFTKIKELLNYPYPYHETLAEEMKSISIAALIVGFILYAFQPFGLSFYEGNKIIVTLMFMGITFSVGLIYALISRKLNQLDSKPEFFTFGRWITGVGLLILAIAIGNYFVSVYYLHSTPGWYTFISNVVSTFLVGIFPTILFGYQYLLRMERQNNQKAIDLNAHLSTSDSEDDHKVILAIQAMENYVNIYEKQGDKLTKTTERRTLQSAHEDSAFRNLIKCHRSYLVNTEYVTEVNGNAQGLKLVLSHPECPTIPVSRSYIGKVKEILS